MAIPAVDQCGHRHRGQPFLDVTGEFKTEATAQQWETQWPTLQRKLRTHPLLVLTGFSTLVTRAQLEREGRVVRLHLAVTHDETLRLLTMAQSLLAWRFGGGAPGR